MVHSCCRTSRCCLLGLCASLRWLVAPHNNRMMTCDPEGNNSSTPCHVAVHQPPLAPPVLHLNLRLPRLADLNPPHHPHLLHQQPRHWYQRQRWYHGRAFCRALRLQTWQHAALRPRPPRRALCCVLRLLRRRRRAAPCLSAEQIPVMSITILLLLDCTLHICGACFKDITEQDLPLLSLILARRILN